MVKKILYNLKLLMQIHTQFYEIDGPVTYVGHKPAYYRYDYDPDQY